MKRLTKNLSRVFVLGALFACFLTLSAFAADTGIITGDVVNARRGPGTSYDRVELLAKGKQVTILGEADGWYQIKWNNSTGYVYKDYVATSGGSAAPAEAQSTEAGPDANATVTGGASINVRTGPGTGYSRVTRLGEGKRVAVLDKDGDWFHISFDGKTGYIFTDYLLPDGSSAPAPAAVEPAAQPEPAPQPAPAAPSIDTSVGNATVQGGNTINVRTGPGTGYSRVTMVAAGKRVTLLSEEGGWFQVEFDGRTGYILGDYLSPDAGALASLVAAETAQNPVPAERADIVVPVATAEATSIESVGAGAPSDSGSTGIITGGTINVRTGPGTEFERITQVSTGKRVTIVGQENGWVRISFGNTTGYVSGEYIIDADSFAASGVGGQVVTLAQQYLGVRYVYGGSSPNGFDCSGFTSYLYRQFGYSLPHTASGQYANCGYKVSKSDLQPGDLVFFTSSGAGGSINHVGVYIGGGQVIHARYSVGKVYINSLSESYYATNYVGAVRIA